MDGLLARRGERPILCLPTGAGKTVCICEVIRRLDVPTVVLAHRRELIHQARDRLAAHGIEAGLILAGEPRTDRRVQVASVQTLIRRDPPPASQVVIDEAHHAVGPTYQRIIEGYPDAWVWGATATPFRLDGRGLSPTFTSIVAPVTVADLVEQGTLIEPTVYAPSQPNLAGVRTVAGDFEQAQLGERMGSLSGNIVEHWLRLCAGKRTIAFAVNVEHSKSLAARFFDAGVPSAHLDGSDDATTRAATLADLRDGRILVLVNCSLFGEGWDLPILEAAILARPTKSLCLHLQQVGRVMRPATGKTSALVLDHAGNHHRHGLVTDAIEYSLDERVRKPAEERLFRTCMDCYALIAPSARVCPQCGFESERAQVPPRETKDELRKFTRVDKEAEYRRLVLTASERRYRLGWARNQYREKFGVWPRQMRHIDDLYQCSQHETQYVANVGLRCARCLRPIRPDRSELPDLTPPPVPF